MNRATACFTRGCWLFALTVSLTGCGRSPETPLDSAQKHFVHGRFDAAIEEAQAALGQSLPQDEQAKLWALQGRCFWEKSGLAGDPATAQKLLDQSLGALGKSIAIMDNSEARIIRSLVYEKLGRQDLSDEDDRVFRELDPEVRKAYINTPELTRYDLPTGDESSGPAASGEPASRPSSDRDEAEPSRSVVRDVLGSDEAVAVPQAEPESPATKESSSESSSEPPKAKPKPRYRGLPKLVNEPKRRARGAAAGESTTSRESTRTESTSMEEESEDLEEPQESEGESEELNEETEGKRRPSEDEGGDLPAYPPLPGSTWQTLESPSGASEPGLDPGGLGSPQAPYGGPLQGVPPTGITGPNLNPSAAAPESGFGPAPTGIVGPRMDPSPSPPPTAPYGVPPTGIVGPPTSQLPGSQLIPGGPGLGRGLPFTAPNPAAGLRVPYTGALPPNLRPAEGTAGSLFSQGPAYSPLRPSPLTNPQMAQPRVPTGGFPTVPQQSPLKRPTPPTSLPRTPLPTSKPVAPATPR